MTEEITRAAINEILTPSFGTTEQYLQVMRVKTQDLQPVVSRVKIYDNQKSAVVYFPIENEHFFIAVYCDLTDLVKIRSVEMEVGSAVYLSIKNSAGSELPVIPERERKDYKFYGINVEEPDDVRNKLDSLLDYLDPYKELIKKISSETSVTIHVQYFGYKDQMWGLHFDSRFMNRIAYLNVEFDLDIYADGESLY